MSFTKRQKIMASHLVPTYGGLSTRKEVKATKLLVRGHYWYDEDYEEYVAFSPTGKRYFFEVNMFSPAPKGLRLHWKKLGCKAAKLWAKGKYKEAIEINDKIYISSRTI